MKRLIIVLILLLLLAAGSCAKTPAPAPTLAPAPAPGPEIFIEADASMDKPSFLPGEDIVIELSFKNVRSEPFQLEPFPPQIEIMRPSPYDEPVRSFTAGTGSRSLEPGEVATYTLVWDQNDEQGQQIPYGYYYIKLGHVRLGDNSMSLSLSGSRQLLILPAEGVIEKEIRVNQSQTVNNITITLEKVALSDLEAMFWAFNTPPGYNLPQGPELPPPSMMALHAFAEYSLDGGPVKKVEPSGIRFYDEGVRHSWKHLDPVPKGTKELTFIITKLGDWEGPWEFHVPIGLTIEEIDSYTDAGETISTSVGGEFAIALYSNPRLGTNWYETHDEKMLALVESPFVAKDKLQPVDGIRYFHFKALEAGKTEIALTYQHGTTGPVSEQKVFKIDIN